MGCPISKLRRQNSFNNPNFFKVVSIKNGQEESSGHIEIADDYILYHKRNNSSISWPIRTLRRYGHDLDLFSFETGRRCPTGQGIFAFRSEQAEELFKFLQDNIQRNFEALSTAHNEDINPLLDPRVSAVRNSRIESIGSINSSCPHTPVSLRPPPPIPSCQSNTLIEEPESNNDDIENNDDVFQQADKVFPVPEFHFRVTTDQKEKPSLYINVESESSDKTPNSPRDEASLYINVPIVKSPNSLSPHTNSSFPKFNSSSSNSEDTSNSSPYISILTDDKSPCGSNHQIYTSGFSPTSKENTRIDQRSPTSPYDHGSLSPASLSSFMDEIKEITIDPNKDLEYVVLELDEVSSPINKLQQSENYLPEGYTTIDFQKTKALMRMTKSTTENDAGCMRRTRHNSALVANKM